MMAKRDQHRSKVYSWEGETIHPNLKGKWLTLLEAQRLADVVMENYNPGTLPRCEVVKGRKTLVRRSYADLKNNRIVLAPSWGLNVETVLHELAHIINWQLYGHWTHGPMFRRIYIDLLVRFADLDRDKLTLAMNRKGLAIHGQEPDYVVDGNRVYPYPF